jgi:ATP-dependent RNA helicase HelY
MALIYDFELDDFQRRAIAALDDDQSVLVAAPTGSGKTVVAEYAVADALAAGRKAFYTTPIKALSNQKYADFVRRHGADQVGLLTGDNAVNGEAPVVVMTTEVLRNMIYAASPSLRGLQYVVLDEVHYLQDAYRGPVWEEVIVHLPEHVQLVCLSATVSNTAELAAWIQTVRGPTTPVVELRRPVHLHDRYLVGDRTNDRLHFWRRSRGAGPTRTRSASTRRRSGGRGVVAARGRCGAVAAGSCTPRGGSRRSSCSSSAGCCRRSCSSSVATSARRRPARVWPLGCG